MFKYLLFLSIFLGSAFTTFAQPCYTICQGESVTLTHAVAGSTVTWYDVNSNVVGTGDQIVSPTASTSYYCIAIDDVDCSFTDPFYCNVIITEPFIGEAPVSFSPNGDGIDDEYCIESICLTDYKLEIFTLTGTVAFSSLDSNECWGGQLFNAAAPTGTYLYLITSNEFGLLSGFITLLP